MNVDPYIFSLDNVRNECRQLIKNSTKSVNVYLPKKNPYSFCPNMITADVTSEHHVTLLHKFCIKILANISDEMVDSIRRSLEIVYYAYRKSSIKIGIGNCEIKRKENCLVIKLKRQWFSSPVDAKVNTVGNDFKCLHKITQKVMSIKFEHNKEMHCFYNHVGLIKNEKNEWLNDPKNSRLLYEKFEKFGFRSDSPLVKCSNKRKYWESNLDFSLTKKKKISAINKRIPSLTEVKSECRRRIDNSKKNISIYLPESNPYSFCPNIITVNGKNVSVMHAFCIKILFDLSRNMIGDISRSIEVVYKDISKSTEYKFSKKLFEIDFENELVINIKDQYFIEKKNMGVNFLRSNLDNLKRSKKIILVRFECQGYIYAFYNEVALIVKSNKSSYEENKWLSDVESVKLLYNELDKFKSGQDLDLSEDTNSFDEEFNTSQRSHYNLRSSKAHFKGSKLEEECSHSINRIEPETNQTLSVSLADDCELSNFFNKKSLGEEFEEFYEHVYADPTKQEKNLGWENGWYKQNNDLLGSNQSDSANSLFIGL